MVCLPQESLNQAGRSRTYLPPSTHAHPAERVRAPAPKATLRSLKTHSMPINQATQQVPLKI